MNIYETFYERQNKTNSGTPDVFFYDRIPNKLRIQIIHISKESIGDINSFEGIYNDEYENVKYSYDIIVDTLRKEFGVFNLNKSSNFNRKQNELFQFILENTDVGKVLSAIELICRIIENRVSQYDYRYDSQSEIVSKSAIAEINIRMKASGLGFEYNKEIIRIDTELLHVETVQPALKLLQDARYAGPEQEFRTAYKHYQNGNHKEAITEAAKSFESTMKIIIENKGWPYKTTDNASKLISILYEHEIIPDYWQHSMSGLRTLLESAIPTPRNKSSAHGQGKTLIIIPNHIVSYVLHMTAATIVFLVRAEGASQPQPSTFHSSQS